MGYSNGLFVWFIPTILELILYPTHYSHKNSCLINKNKVASLI